MIDRDQSRNAQSFDWQLANPPAVFEAACPPVWRRTRSFSMFPGIAPTPDTTGKAAA